MKYQFTNHDYVVEVPEKYEALFSSDEQRNELAQYLRALPPFQTVGDNEKLLPAFGCLLMPKTHVLSAFDFALMEMSQNGLGIVNETTMLLYLIRKVKEIELMLKYNEPEPKSGGLIL